MVEAVKHTRQKTASRGYDLIGDVHGCAMTLRHLLEYMGYRKVNGVYQHSRRQAIFIGDIVDRGPRIREALHIVRDMVDRGAAQLVMGNHEYNALSYSTRTRTGADKPFLRAHTPRHRRLIQETLEQFTHHDREWNEFLQWFFELPLFLEIDHFRVVHACWDNHLINAFKERFHSNCIDEDFLHASAVRDSFAGRVVERLLRGTDMPLPDGMTITGKDGFTRSFFRTKFWAEDPKTYGDLVFQPDPLPVDIARRPLTERECRHVLTYGPEQPPVFVGHYWMQGIPKPLKPNVVCLDYSAVKYGKLVAYRMDGETRLLPEKFVWVNVERPEQAAVANEPHEDDD